VDVVIKQGLDATVRSRGAGSVGVASGVGGAEGRALCETRYRHGDMKVCRRGDISLKQSSSSL
jgi:hypothetical protein